MRYLEITVPEGKRRAVLNILEDEGIDYVISDETSGREYTAVVRFPIPTQAVEPLLDRLKRTGVGDEARVVVIDAETVISEGFATLQEQYSYGGQTGARTSRQVLRTKADELTPPFPIYAAMLLISAVVATAGLLADSPAVVIGAMVIAPLLGPALAANIGIVTGDARLKSTGFRYQLVGVGLVVAASIGLAVLARLAGLEPAGVDIVVATELEERVSPNLFSLAVALGAGIAGILSLTRGFSEAIVGVMIAAALIPPSAAVGITVAWGMSGAATGAAVLVVVNLLSVNLAALATLWVAGYRPQGLFEVSPTRTPTYTYAAIFGIGLLVLAVPLASVTLLDFHTTELESATEAEVEDVLTDPRYEEFEIEDIVIELDGNYPVQSVDRVIVTVSSQNAGTEPGLADHLYREISPHTDDPIVVEVQYIVAEERGRPEQGDTANGQETDVQDGPLRVSKARA
ncbi:putative hydrophobic protein (TIGR00341 family) [Natrinema hispanicum]|uniref:Putative hydrophobic protein (TIGR00341 family) n=1 Tax=Natrinema hispanicum TaxID=392421 RepID=A0A482YEM5_9EURY|nr:TIGR00341 family protein [Natrinema hispanicum]RZV11470.1 putative hydrophobic protein (TIGR00341 family) [Natrinema hispanicum]